MKIRKSFFLLPLLAAFMWGCNSDAPEAGAAKAGEKADEHAGHNHAPGEGHDDATAKSPDKEQTAAADEHAGHNHAPGEGHGEATTTATAAPKVKITDLTVGKGPAAAPGDLLLMEYTGTFKNGKQFDSNDPKNKPGANPFSFVLGAGAVIKGWDQGLVGIKVGGVRNLVVPWQLAYGAEGNEGIPPRSDLNFRVKALDMVKKGEEEIYDKTVLKNGTGPVVKKGSKISVHYSGKLVNGKQFDSSYERKQPLEIEVGRTSLIAGFSAGLEGMRQGGKYRLRIPPHIGYGPVGQPPAIPGNSVLIFDIEVLKVR